MFWADAAVKLIIETKMQNKWFRIQITFVYQKLFHYLKNLHNSFGHMGAAQKSAKYFQVDMS